ncbi:hypothetical protein MW887_009219 [Aspergillus wentii]|nr:hypothetical protein MW887_009219 [Aspergillus wentii]
MPTDPDGDSQMASSPESQSGFPQEDSPAGSRTPTATTASHNSRAQFAAASELSPPGSQTKQISGVSGAAMGMDKGIPISAESQQQQPGASWMNKRAEEEYQRAMEFVVDKDFSLSEFGDPFDERDMEEKLV